MLTRVSCGIWPLLLNIPIWKTPITKRKDTKLESQGAEFLVLGHLLIEGISAYKAYVNFPGYDLTAVNAITRRVARLQVKSRWATDYDKSFPIKNFDCDFVIHVALNRGYAFSKRKYSSKEGMKPPEFWVFPVQIVKTAQNARDTWGKVHIPKIPEFNTYKSNWPLISEFLGPSDDHACNKFIGTCD